MRVLEAAVGCGPGRSACHDALGPAVERATDRHLAAARAASTRTSRAHGAGLGDPPAAGRVSAGLPHPGGEAEVADQLVRVAEPSDVVDRGHDRSSETHDAEILPHLGHPVVLTSSGSAAMAACGTGGRTPSPPSRMSSPFTPRTEIRTVADERTRWMILYAAGER
jgi:hypothetical protein